MSLFVFVGDRLNEDERVAREASYWGDLPLGHLASDLEAHLIRWMPPRALADVAAKRLILAEVSSQLTDDGTDETARYLLCLLALPYAGHAEYRDEWRPVG